MLEQYYVLRKKVSATHEVEKCEIAELDTLRQIERYHKEILNRYRDRQHTQVRMLALQLIRQHEELIKALVRTQDARTKAIAEREAPKSAKFDYTRYDDRTI